MTGQVTAAGYVPFFLNLVVYRAYPFLVVLTRLERYKEDFKRVNGLRVY